MTGAPFETFNEAHRALGIGTREVVALIGGGGKTSLMYRLAEELCRDSLVITSTTTKIATPDERQSPCLILTRDNPGWPELLKQSLGAHRHVTLAHYGYGDGKLKGHERVEMDGILAGHPAPLVILEADGARQKPLKAARAGEPQVPERSTLIVGLIGWDCLDRTIVEENVHRAALFCDELGLACSGSRVTQEVLEAWIVHPRGLRKGVPAGARFVVFLNKCDFPEELDSASRLLERIAHNTGAFDFGIAASIHRGVYRRVCGS